MNEGNLPFEAPIIALKEQIAELERFNEKNDVDLAGQITETQEKCTKVIKEIYAKLTEWEIAQVSRYIKRPHTSDYIKAIFTDFHELHGDRHYADDASIIAGLARIDDLPVMVIGQEKGSNTKENVKRNFGMPKPEGYRKALRLMKLAEKYQIPIITFIDTPGAYPGIGAEERGQSEAIARNIYEMSRLKVPTIACVIGEGGSGGALAIGVADKVMMLEYSIYSVISPDGCASILWRDPKYAADAAKAMQVTSKQLKKLGLIDSVVKEPFGGAHNKPEEAAANLHKAISETLADLNALSEADRYEKRMAKIRAFGQFEEA